MLVEATPAPVTLAPTSPLCTVYHFEVRMITLVFRFVFTIYYCLKNELENATELYCISFLSILQTVFFLLKDSKFPRKPLLLEYNKKTFV
jgi:hypothetical protein